MSFLTQILQNIASYQFLLCFICTYSCTHKNMHAHKQTSLCSSLECLNGCIVRLCLPWLPHLFSFSLMSAHTRTHTRKTLPTLLYNSTREWAVTYLTFVPPCLCNNTLTWCHQSPEEHSSSCMCLHYLQCAWQRKCKWKKMRERHLSSPDTSHQYVTALSLVCFCVGDRKKNQKLCPRSHATVYKWTLFNAVHRTLYQGQHCPSTGHLKLSCNTRIA